jgi:hypothetical protein
LGSLLVKKAVPDISADAAEGSEWTRLAVFMASFLI